VLLVLVVVGGLAVVLVALVAVGRETFTLRDQPRQALFDLDEAVDRVADDLPFEVSAKLSYEEVRMLLGWYLDLLADAGVPDDRARAAHGELVVVDREGAARTLVGRAGDAGIDANADDVRSVLASADTYFAAIGAIGPQVSAPAEPEETPDDQPRRDRGHTD
jgi:hypothetical protein